MDNNQQPLDFSKEMQYYSKRRKRRAIAWGIASPFIATLLIVIIAMLTAAAPRVAPVTDYNGGNKYITFQNRPLVSAHRAGGALAPENTLKAFEKCLDAEYKVDILEFDLHITRDGEIILLHDHTLNRTSNAEEIFGEKKAKPTDYTLEQIRQLNMAENFETPDGKFPYRGLRGDDLPADLRIVTLEEVLEYTEDKRPDGLSYIIEIKDGGDDGRLATDKLYKVLKQRNLLDKAIVGTFQGEITQYMDEKYPDFIRSSSINEVLDFYFCFLFDIDLSKKKLGYEVMQVPYKLAGINLGHKSVIDYAHKYGLAVQYWTINDEEDIRTLISRGADAIITDDPELADRIVRELRPSAAVVDFSAPAVNVA